MFSRTISSTADGELTYVKKDILSSVRNYLGHKDRPLVVGSSTIFKSIYT